MDAPSIIIPARNYEPDNLAGWLAKTAQMARSMPPSWDGAGITHLVASPDGDYCGKILPGRGLFIPHELRELGIRRPIPGVYPRSPVRKLIEKLGGDERAAIRVFDNLYRVEGGAIATYDGIIAARGGGKAFDIVISKASITTVANAYSSIIRATGVPGAYSYQAIPGGEAPDRSKAGAWSTGLADPGGSDLKYLLTVGFTAAQQLNMIILIDLLVAAGSILATVNTAQTVNSTALTRYVSGAGVLMTFEVTTQLSNTAHTMTVNKYTGNVNGANQTTGAQTGTAAAIVDRLVPVGLGPFMQLAAGDYGVLSVEEYTNSVALAAGVFGLNLYFPLAFIPGLAANAYVERDSTVQIDGLAELVQTAGGVLGFLGAYVLPNTTSTGINSWFLRTCDG